MIKLTFARKVVAAAVCAVALIGPAQADDKKVYRLKLAETWPTNFGVFSAPARNMAELAEKLSNGRLKIEIDTANKHKSAMGVFDMVRAGQYDLGHSASYYWKGKDENTQFLTTRPFGMTATEQYGWFYYGGGMELMQKVYEPYNLISVPGGNTGMQMGGWFRKEIKSLDDLKGLKIRIPGFAGEIFARVGASPTNVAPGEMYTSLERGAIDAVEWVGPSMDLRLGFHKIAPFYYSGWQEPATELQFLLNKRKFEALPADLQQILLTAMRVSAYDMTIESHHLSGQNWVAMKTEFPNVQVKSFPPEVMAALRKANDELLAEITAKNPLTKEIVESQDAYLKQVRQWTDIADRTYLNNMAE